jgi:hypothetical protein
VIKPNRSAGGGELTIECAHVLGSVRHVDAPLRDRSFAFGSEDIPFYVPERHPASVLRGYRAWIPETAANLDRCAVKAVIFSSNRQGTCCAWPES